MFELHLQDTGKKRHKLEGYSAKILNKMSDSELRALAKNAVKQQDYQGLKHLLKHDSRALSAIFREALEKLDIQAIEIACGHEQAPTEISRNNWLSEVYDNQGMHCGYSYKKEKELKAVIYRLVANVKETFNVHELYLLSTISTQEEFEDFCKSHNIDLSKPEFERLDLSIYRLNNTTALVQLPQSIECPNTADIILSRTYSTIISTDQAREIYNNILQADFIANEMLSYLSTQIAKGDSVRIIFEKEALSSYNPLSNVIKVSTNFLNETTFNFASVFIHEVGHYFYDHIFQNNALPVDRAVAQNLCNLVANEFPYIRSYEFRLFLGENNSLKESAKSVFDYEKAAKYPILKAAELLRIDTTSMEPLVVSEDYAKYLKENSIIDLFLLNAEKHYKFSEKSSESKIPSNVWPVILDIYLQQQDTPCDPEISPEQLEEWILETFLPKTIKELGLSPKQVHFLERIADYVNRSNDDDGELYQELIVRYAELKVAGVEEDLVNSFEALAEFHREYATPMVAGELAQYHGMCSQNDEL